ncbi:unnamed protein product [Rotaria sordida]|uniref:DED domain-containing protein n=1 Tax=Rotaria sordida TaxID=392033 RepID=A0A813SPG5_9BILA|nr:unnamed protein product [Rotaria sordida]CAF4115726.1 unnamed protein product [Rotaria sordida]
MDEQFDFRALLLKLQDCLSDNDRRRLHFIVGDTIPRRLRDNPTLGGTLDLLESLFDQAKISEQDFDYLIHTFNEIHCYQAVQRLKEHQLVQKQRNQNETIINLPDLFDDNEEDTMNPNLNVSDCVSSNDSQQRDSASSQVTISFNANDIHNDTLHLTKTQIQSETKQFKINLIFLKQKLKSRLTKCQLIFFLLHIICILILILLIIFLTKSKRSISDILLIQSGDFYGNRGGGYEFNDARDYQLTLYDKIVTISAGWTSDTLDYVTFLYSNKRSMQRGRQTYRYSPYTSEFVLNPDESINRVTIYTNTRLIDNPFAPNGTFLVVGLRFYTDKERSSELFGSSNGTQMDESFSNFTLAYIRGNALGYIDALQFIWYRKISPSSAATLLTN